MLHNYITNIDETSISGILLNSISDHQMIFTYVENVSYITEVPKFIEVERSEERSMHNFVKELDEICIYEQLQPALDANPQENYDIFIKLVTSAKNKHLPKKIVRFNKKKLKKAKWLTNGILKSINIKDKMYKILAKRDNVNEAAYTNLKAEFNPIQSGLFQTVNDPGGRGGFKPPPPYDLENHCVSLHHIIHANFTKCFRHVKIGIFQKFAILTILQRFQNKK